MNKQTLTKQQAINTIKNLMKQYNISTIKIPDNFYDYAGCYIFTLDDDNFKIVYDTTTQYSKQITGINDIPSHIFKQAVGLLTIDIT